jgi:hypothetical protein
MDSVMDRLVSPEQAAAELVRRRIEELEACLKIAMDEWAGWLDDSRGTEPEGESWDRCVKALRG